MLFMHETANVMQEMPTLEANNSADCSRRVKVHLDDVVPTHVYNSDVFIDCAHWQSKNEKAARTELLAFKTSKQGKIVMIGSPKPF